MKSRRRSAERHHVDPQSTAAPRILTAGELRERREPIESVVLAAQPELDRLNATWIIALAPLSDEQLAPLLAIDRDYRVLGADRCARAQFGITPERLQSGLSLWTFFAPSSSLLLKEVGGIESRCALVSPPALSLRARMSACDATFLMRPRSMLLVSLERHFFVQPPSGGLPAGVLRRICEHIESHLEDNISLEVLAADAGFSLYHFARAFRQSMGISPHRYVMQQRVRKAQQLLARTDLPLATIAASVGFADQSHFSRHFRRLAGTTPSGFRRAQR